MAGTAPQQPHVTELYAPQLLTIHVGPNSRVFQVPRGIICPLSRYFNKAFSERFSEGQNGLIELKHVQEWIFECFVAWLYTNQLTWQPDPIRRTEGGPTAPDNRDSGVSLLENDRENAVTWSWPFLFNLYLFADQYDTVGFREAVLQTCQLKAFQTWPYEYLYPNNSEAASMLKSLPETSPLSRLLVDILVYNCLPDDLADTGTLEEFPPAVLAEMFTKAAQLERLGHCNDCKARRECNAESHPNIKRIRNPFFYDPCEYHEHETEEARKLCRAKWVELDAKHKLDLQLKSV